MGYETERKSITNWLKDQDFFGLKPFGLDGAVDKMVAGSGWMNILSGAAGQRSIGSPGTNLHEYAGVLAITILTEGRDGSGPGKEFADEIIGQMTGLKLDEWGTVVTASGTATVIDFARAGVPYVSFSQPEAPFHRTVINAPFIRSERR